MADTSNLAVGKENSRSCVLKNLGIECPYCLLSDEHFRNQSKMAETFENFKTNARNDPKYQSFDKEILKSALRLAKEQHERMMDDNQRRVLRRWRKIGLVKIPKTLEDLFGDVPSKHRTGKKKEPSAENFKAEIHVHRDAITKTNYQGKDPKRSSKREHARLETNALAGLRDNGSQSVVFNTPMPLFDPTLSVDGRHLVLKERSPSPSMMTELSIDTSYYQEPPRNMAVPSPGGLLLQIAPNAILPNTMQEQQILLPDPPPYEFSDKATANSDIAIPLVQRPSQGVSTDLTNVEVTPRTKRRTRLEEIINEFKDFDNDSDGGDPGQLGSGQQPKGNQFHRSRTWAEFSHQAGRKDSPTIHDLTEEEVTCSKGIGRSPFSSLKSTPTGSPLRRVYSEVLHTTIDEFQDTSPLQPKRHSEYFGHTADDGRIPRSKLAEVDDKRRSLNILNNALKDQNRFHQSQDHFKHSPRSLFRPVQSKLIKAEEVRTVSGLPATKIPRPESESVKFKRSVSERILDFEKHNRRMSLNVPRQLPEMVSHAEGPRGPKQLPRHIRIPGEGPVEEHTSHKFARPEKVSMEKGTSHLMKQADYPWRKRVSSMQAMHGQDGTEKKYTSKPPAPPTKLSSSFIKAKERAMQSQVVRSLSTAAVERRMSDSFLVERKKSPATRLEQILKKMGDSGEDMAAIHEEDHILAELQKSGQIAYQRRKSKGGNSCRANVDVVPSKNNVGSNKPAHSESGDKTPSQSDFTPELHKQISESGQGQHAKDEVTTSSPKGTKKKIQLLQKVVSKPKVLRIPSPMQIVPGVEPLTTYFTPIVEQSTQELLLAREEVDKSGSHLQETKPLCRVDWTDNLVYQESTSLFTYQNVLGIAANEDAQFLAPDIQQRPPIIAQDIQAHIPLQMVDCSDVNQYVTSPPSICDIETTPEFNPDVSNVLPVQEQREFVTGDDLLAITPLQRVSWSNELIQNPFSPDSCDINAADQNGQTASAAAKTVPVKRLSKTQIQQELPRVNWAESLLNVSSPPILSDVASTSDIEENIETTETTSILESLDLANIDDFIPVYSMVNWSDILLGYIMSPDTIDSKIKSPEFQQTLGEMDSGEFELADDDFILSAPLSQVDWTENLIYNAHGPDLCEISETIQASPAHKAASIQEYEEEIAGSLRPVEFVDWEENAVYERSSSGSNSNTTPKFPVADHEKSDIVEIEGCGIEQPQEMKKKKEKSNTSFPPIRSMDDVMIPSRNMFSVSAKDRYMRRKSDSQYELSQLPVSQKTHLQGIAEHVNKKKSSTKNSPAKSNKYEGNASGNIGVSERTSSCESLGWYSCESEENDEKLGEKNSKISGVVADGKRQLSRHTGKANKSKHKVRQASPSSTESSELSSPTQYRRSESSESVSSSGLDDNFELFRPQLPRGSGLCDAACSTSDDLPCHIHSPYDLVDNPETFNPKVVVASELHREDRQVAGEIPDLIGDLRKQRADGYINNRVSSASTESNSNSNEIEDQQELSGSADYTSGQLRTMNDRLQTLIRDIEVLDDNLEEGVSGSKPSVSHVGYVFDMDARERERLHREIITASRRLASETVKLIKSYEKNRTLGTPERLCDSGYSSQKSTLCRDSYDLSVWSPIGRDSPVTKDTSPPANKPIRILYNRSLEQSSPEAQNKTEGNARYNENNVMRGRQEDRIDAERSLHLVNTDRNSWQSEFKPASFDNHTHRGEQGLSLLPLAPGRNNKKQRNGNKSHYKIECDEDYIELSPHANHPKFVSAGTDRVSSRNNAEYDSDSGREMNWSWPSRHSQYPTWSDSDRELSDKTRNSGSHSERSGKSSPVRNNTRRSPLALYSGGVNTVNSYQATFARNQNKGVCAGGSQLSTRNSESDLGSTGVINFKDSCKAKTEGGHTGQIRMPVVSEPKQNGPVYISLSNKERPTNNGVRNRIRRMSEAELPGLKQRSFDLEEREPRVVSSLRRFSVSALDNKYVSRDSTKISSLSIPMRERSQPTRKYNLPFEPLEDNSGDGRFARIDSYRGHPSVFTPNDRRYSENVMNGPLASDFSEFKSRLGSRYRSPSHGRATSESRDNTPVGRFKRGIRQGWSFDSADDENSDFSPELEPRDTWSRHNGLPEQGHSEGRRYSEEFVPFSNGYQRDTEYQRNERSGSDIMVLPQERAKLSPRRYSVSTLEQGRKLHQDNVLMNGYPYQAVPQVGTQLRRLSFDGQASDYSQRPLQVSLPNRRTGTGNITAVPWKPTPFEAANNDMALNIPRNNGENTITIGRYGANPGVTVSANQQIAMLGRSTEHGTEFALWTMAPQTPVNPMNMLQTMQGFGASNNHNPPAQHPLQNQGLANPACGHQPTMASSQNYSNQVHSDGALSNNTGVYQQMYGQQMGENILNAQGNMNNIPGSQRDLSHQQGRYIGVPYDTVRGGLNQPAGNLYHPITQTSAQPLPNGYTDPKMNQALPGYQGNGWQVRAEDIGHKESHENARGSDIGIPSTLYKNQNPCSCQHVQSEFNALATLPEKASHSSPDKPAGNFTQHHTPDIHGEHEECTPRYREDQSQANNQMDAMKNTHVSTGKVTSNSHRPSGSGNEKNASRNPDVSTQSGSIPSIPGAFLSSNGEGMAHENDPSMPTTKSNTSGASAESNKNDNLSSDYRKISLADDEIKSETVLPSVKNMAKLFQQKPGALLKSALQNGSAKCGQENINASRSTEKCDIIGGEESTINSSGSVGCSIDTQCDLNTSSPKRENTEKINKMTTEGCVQTDSQRPEEDVETNHIEEKWVGDDVGTQSDEPSRLLAVITEFSMQEIKYDNPKSTDDVCTNNGSQQNEDN